MTGFMNPDLFIFDHANATARYLPGYFATRAVRP